MLEIVPLGNARDIAPVALHQEVQRGIGRYRILRLRWRLLREACGGQQRSKRRRSRKVQERTARGKSVGKSVDRTVMAHGNLRLPLFFADQFRILLRLETSTPCCA